VIFILKTGGLKGLKEKEQGTGEEKGKRGVYQSSSLYTSQGWRHEVKVNAELESSRVSLFLYCLATFSVPLLDKVPRLAKRGGDGRYQVGAGGGKVVEIMARYLIFVETVPL